MTQLPDWIEELKRLEKEATPGPWYSDQVGQIGHTLPEGRGVICDFERGVEVYCKAHADKVAIVNDDADFIAASRSAIPKLIDLVQRQAALLKEAEEALASIASLEKLRQDQEKYWLGISHKQCATVLATDTKIAREALAKIRAMREGK